MNNNYKDNIKRETEIKRIKKERNFTTISNEVLQRKDLSWKAKGIMAYIMSLPDDWKIILEEVYKNATDGKTSFNSGWKELKNSGYVKNVAVRDEETKKILYWKTIVSEEGNLKENSENYEIQNYETQNIKTHKLETYDVENQTLQSTNIQSTNIQNTNNTNNTHFTNASEIKKQKDKEIEEQFKEWYNIYNKKMDRAKALKSFKTKYKKHGYEKILEGTKAYLKTVTDKQYQKYPATFLNAESYLDIEEFSNVSKNRPDNNAIEEINVDEI